MITIVKKAAERRRFAEATKKAREAEAARHTQLNLPPVFNKRHFSKGDVIVTSEARRIMEKKSSSLLNDEPLGRNEIAAMRCVVDGLKLIHKGVAYVKDCLAHCVTYESYKPFQYVTKQQHESSLSCYYILHGSVEVTYDFGVSNSLQVFEPNIIYTHTSGEYLGLVRSEEGVQDISPPATVYTKEPCECLRVDRRKFHRTVALTRANDIREKDEYMNNKRCVLGDLTAEERMKLIPKLLKVVCIGIVSVPCPNGLFRPFHDSGPLKMKKFDRFAVEGQ
jgi:CRP-like cAMP-binding protein